MNEYNNNNVSNYNLVSNDDQRYTITIIEENNIRDICLNDFNKNKITFGRAQSNDIVFSSLLVSSNHGYFEICDNRLRIVDNSSTNGLYINNNKMNDCILKDGDSIKIDNPVEPLDRGIIMIFTLGNNFQEWQQFDLGSKDNVSIGRSADCDIVLNHVTVSLKNAIIVRHENSFVISVVGNTNNVMLNGRLLSGQNVLKERDVILIANAKLIYNKGRLLYQMSHKGVGLDAVDIVKTVKIKGKKKNISHHVNLSVKPGQFVAFVGGSGAGKSTFMNCISGVSRPTSGSVYVNGNNLLKNYSALKNIIGYVPQDDIVFNDLTLIDMLRYSADLRMPDDSSYKEKMNRIDEVLEIVELSNKKDVVIRNLSGGQRKRASIAVELLADPKLFFLDEPTSGLDPGTERSLMKTLRNMANNGKTIILVTHNTLNLHLCDKIVFFGVGGKLCFSGKPADSLKFFEVNDFVDIYSLLNAHTDEWYEKFNNSSYKEEVIVSEEKEEIKQKGKNKKSFTKQFITLSKRYLKTIINDKQQLFLLLFQGPFIAYAITVLVDEKLFENYEFTRMMLFNIACSGIWVGLLNSIQLVCKEKVILKREYMADLKLTAYLGSKIWIQCVICLIQSIAFIGVFTKFVYGVPKEGIVSGWFFEMVLVFFLTVVSASAMGLLVSVFSKNSSTAVNFAPILLIPQLVFSGSIISLNGIADKISNFILCRWSMQAFGTINDLNSLTDVIQEIYPSYVREPDPYYTFTSTHFYNVIGVILLMTGVLLVLSYIFLKRQLESSR